MLTLAVCAVAAALAAGRPARADDDLRKQLAALAEEIHKVVKDDPVALGDFSGPAGANASGDSTLKRLLAEELQKHDVRVEVKAGMEIKGDYGKAKNRASNRDEFKMTVQVLNTETRDIVATLPGRYVADTDTLVKLMGGTGHVDPVNNGEEYRRRISKLIDNPSVFVDGSVVKSRADSPFSMQVLVKAGGRLPAQPRQAHDVNGQAFLGVDFGDEVVVVLTNNSRTEVAATLSLDGLDMFFFAEETNPKTGQPFRYWVLRPGQAVRIEGWFKTRTEALAFEVAPKGHGAATAVLGSAAKVGTITATFAPAHDTPPPPPTAPTVGAPQERVGAAAPAEAGAPDSAPVPLEAAAPGQGDPAEIKTGKRVAIQTADPVARDVGAVIDFISVRYERPRRGQ
jgi:hypothetical protein